MINRLILIGNGFDLAHGLKTSYKDFIENYICSAINLFISGGCHDDIFLFIGSESSREKIKPINSILKAKEIVSILEKQKGVINFKSLFFKKIFEASTLNNWVDVENEYFDHLKSLIYDKNGTCKLQETLHPDYNLVLDKIKLLNQEFDFLKSLLEQYLNDITSTFIPQNFDEFEALVCQKIDVNENPALNLEKEELPNSLYFLNFNYTHTVENYFELLSIKIDRNLNYIHGKLNNPHNPIIFGFGDEHDKDFKKFETIKSKEQFDHIKSFKYSKTVNYQKALGYIDSCAFEVYVLGHSCGLSDRTLLKSIFEHENCKSIRVFYYENGNGTNDYWDKQIDISRHFYDKSLFRKKLVSEQNSIPLKFNLTQPQ
jgi:hypothetical protein